MGLKEELLVATRKVVKDGYDMSIGELMSLYKTNELVINPKYQRYFRWDESQKTRFIESLMLGIPIPPIFVYTTGKQWELVDGLQRISTILEFAGILRDPDDPSGNTLRPPSTLEGTSLLPSLAGKKWSPADDNDEDCLTEEQQFDLKRARIRVEILKKESDPIAKYELFQRLNGGGSTLSEQEMRSCVIVMIDETFHDWLNSLISHESFAATTLPTERAEKRQLPLELALRFLAFHYVPYNGLDVHEYLDSATITMASSRSIDRTVAATLFHQVFDWLKEAFEGNPFRKWNGTKFTGSFMLSAFECITHGLAHNFDSILEMKNDHRVQWLSDHVRSLWNEPTFDKYSKAGVRGTTRLKHLLPFGKEYFKP
jgi:hypothetical protein